MYITWFCYIWRVVVLSFSPSKPKLVNFHHFLDFRSWEKTYIYKYIYICVYYMILLYLEGSGSKFQSVNTKTSQFFPFFGFQQLRKHMSTPKLVNFPHFLDSRSWERNMSTPKLVNFPHFLDSRSWERNMSTPKLVNFHHFLDSRSWERNMSTPKRVNFPHFLDSRSWEKNMSTPKLVNFPHFLDSRSWQKTCIYIYIYLYIVKLPSCLSILVPFSLAVHRSGGRVRGVTRRGRTKET